MEKILIDIERLKIELAELNPKKKPRLLNFLNILMIIGIITLLYLVR